MVAKPGNGAVIPHWAHKPGSLHVIVGNGEMGEWHQEVQSLFAILGAQTEVTMPSADGQRSHIADIVLPDGRIIEAQTHFLDIEQLASREQTYGNMAWIYNAHDYNAWFIIDDTRTQYRFRWGQGKADRRFLSHTKPVYFDTGDAIWRLDSVTRRHIKGGKGRTLWEGTRTKVAEGLLEFVEKISNGEPFGPVPTMPHIDPRKTISGTRLRTLQDLDEWIADNPTCGYKGTAEEIYQRDPPPQPSRPAFINTPELIAAFDKGTAAATQAFVDRPFRDIRDAPKYYTPQQKIEWLAAG